MGLEDPLRRKHTVEVQEKTDSQILDNTLNVIQSISAYIAREHTTTYHSNTQKVLRAFSSLISSLRDSNELDRSTMHRAHFLLTAFVDLVIVDGMAESHITHDSFRLRYARESSFVFSTDDFYKALNAGSTTLFAGAVVDSNESEYSYGISGTIEELFQTVERMLSDMQDNRADRYYLRKMRAVAQLDEHQRLAFEARHREHYKQLFALNGVPPHDVQLTSSGTSANDAVLRALRKQYPRAKAEFLYGWYYENLREIELFETSEPCDAKVMLLNVESSFPIDDYQYTADFNEHIGRTIESARSHPQLPHFLVIDCTTDLLIGSEFFSSLPPNMTLIKTCSLTKHQRGGTNYFFGSIALWSNDQTLGGDIRTEVLALDAALNQFEATHFPRLRKSELQVTMERNERLQRAFNTSFNKVQSTLPKALQCKLYNYNYFTYVSKPFNRVPNALGDRVFQLDRPDLCLDADSFGLSENRVCSFYTVLQGDDQERLSFGTDATEEQMIELGALSAQKWVECVTTTKAGTDFMSFLSDELLDREKLCAQLEQFYILECKHVTTITTLIHKLTGNSFLSRGGLSNVDIESQQFSELASAIESLEESSIASARTLPAIFGLYWLIHDYRVRLTILKYSVSGERKNDSEPLTVSDLDAYLRFENRRAPNPYTRPDEYRQYVRSYIDEWKEALMISNPHTLKV